MRTRWILGFVVLLVAGGAAVIGCLDAAATYSCGAAKSCDSGHMCIQSRCAAADAACASGYRWDSTAGTRSGQCAGAPADMAVDPTCGNGVLDSGETCDDSAGVPCPTAASCDDHEPCTTDILEGPACHVRCLHSYVADDLPCPGPNPDGGTAGVCHSHACCRGCWNGSTCVSGGEVAACGLSGKSCASCGPADGGVECLTPTCTKGVCASPPVTNNTPCKGGVCESGACCPGCIVPTDGGAAQCMPGLAKNACGSGGTVCSACVNGCGPTDGGVRCTGCVPTCPVNAQCGSDGCGGTCGAGCSGNQQCQAGKCVCVATGAEDNDAVCGNGFDDDCNGKTDCADPGCNVMRCSAQGQFCSNGRCLAGCRIAGNFFSDGSVNPTNGCQVCKAMVDDSGWTALADASSCGGGAGKCWKGACCQGCWDGSQCVGSPMNGSPATCGNAGALCASCDDGKPCTLDSCDAGVCKHDATALNGKACGPGMSCGNTVACTAANCSNSCLISPACQNGTCGQGATTTVCCAKGLSCSSGSNGTKICD